MTVGSLAMTKKGRSLRVSSADETISWGSFWNKRITNEGATVDFSTSCLPAGKALEMTVDPLNMTVDPLEMTVEAYHLDLLRQA